MPDEAETKKEQIKGANSQKPLVPGWLIENIAEASKNARKIYFLYVGFLAYCALTVVSTSDRNIILNEEAHLPIVNLDVSLNGFFIVAPMMSILIFVYFQLYLQRLKGLTDDLRANYAQTEKRRLYPWIINISKDPEPGVIGKMQMLTVKVSVWLSLPLVLSLLAFWYIKKHEPFWSYIVGSLAILGTLVSIWFWREYESGKDRKGLSVFGVGDIALLGVLLTFQISVLTAFVPLAAKVEMHEFLRPYLCVNLSYQNLVSKPKDDYKNIPWQKLRNVHLEGANMNFSILEKADLFGSCLVKSSLQNAVLRKAYAEGADLQGADLQGADLQGAKFLKANLQDASLQKANLQDSDLQKANLQGADLWLVNLQEANLEGANLKQGFLPQADLKKAKLIEADLQKAVLWGATLQKAILWRTNLEEAILWRTNLQKANLWGANLQKADLPAASFQEANLMVANFQEANLEGANLQKANLKGANLQKANLRGAKLEGANLAGARNLTIEQLCTVKTLYDAELDPRLQKTLKEKCPLLFEKPTSDHKRIQEDIDDKEVE